MQKLEQPDFASSIAVLCRTRKSSKHIQMQTKGFDLHQARTEFPRQDIDIFRRYVPKKVERDVEVTFAHELENLSASLPRKKKKV